VTVYGEDAVDKVDCSNNVESDPFWGRMMFVRHFDDFDLTFCFFTSGECSWEQSLFVAETTGEGIKSRGRKTTVNVSN
jgi:hypothetical protein